METEQRLRESFIEALSLDAATDFESLAYRENPNWDSLAHMQLIAVLENNFDIMIDTDDVIAMSSYKIARDILTGYGVEFA